MLTPGEILILIGAAGFFWLIWHHQATVKKLEDEKAKAQREAWLKQAGKR